MNATKRFRNVDSCRSTTATAARTDLTPRERDVTNLMTKTGSPNRVRLAVLAVRNGR